MFSIAKPLLLVHCHICAQNSYLCLSVYHGLITCNAVVGSFPVIVEGLMTDGKMAMERRGQGLRKGQIDENNMWADSFPIMCFIL
jgi:hypothetical protein